MAVKVRKDLDKPVEWFIEKLEPDRRAIVATLHRLILAAAPSIESGLKWGMPFYSKNGMLGFIMVAKSYVSLGFVRGSSLKDPKKLLTAGSSKTMRSLRLTSAKDIPPAAVKAWVKQAVKLNAP